MPIRRSAALLALATTALAQGGYEGPATFKAAEILPHALVKGPHFQVKDPVPTPGYFHEFQIASDFGAMQAEGRSLLVTRIREIDALARLDDVSKSEVFLAAAGNSVLRVGKGVVSVVADPKGTAKGIGGGAKRFGTNLGRKGKRAADQSADAATGGDKQAGTQPEKSTGDQAADAGAGAAKAVFGVNAAMRRWAQKLQVDPYTSNAVLKKALEDVAEIDAAGGIAAKVVVPIPAVVGTTASVGGLVWGQDPEALLKLNEQRVAELGTDKKAAGEFFKNKAFKLGYQTRFIAALYAVKVPGCGSYVDTAEGAENERQAVFFTDSAELLQRFHAKQPVELVLPDSRALVAKTKDGRAVVLLAVDYVRWTDAFENAAAEVALRARAELGTARLELHLTGRASERAKRELTTRGWKVVENLPGTLEASERVADAEHEARALLSFLGVEDLGPGEADRAEGEASNAALPASASSAGQGRPARGPGRTATRAQVSSSCGQDTSARPAPPAPVERAGAGMAATGRGRPSSFPARPR